MDDNWLYELAIERGKRIKELEQKLRAAVPPRIERTELAQRGFDSTVVDL